MEPTEVTLSPQELSDRLGLLQKQIHEYSRDFARIYKQERVRRLNLQEMHDKLRAIVNSIFDALVATDENLRIQDFNNAFQNLIWKRSESVLDKSLFDVVEIKPFLHQIEELKRNGTSRISFEFSPENHSDLTYLTTVTKSSTSQSKNSGYVFTFRDVTENKQLEKLKGRLFTFASNEVRKPLKGLLGLLNYLYDDLGKKLNEDELAHFHFLIESGENLEKIIEDLMRFSPLDQYSENRIDSVDLGDIMWSAIGEIENDSQSLGVDIHFNSPKTVIISADRVLLSRAFACILRSLICSSNPNSKIDIDFAAKGKALEIHFRCSSLLAKRTQIERLLTVAEDGLDDIGRHGISLALAKDILDWNGGKIRIEEGSTFNLIVSFNDWSPKIRGKKKLTS